MSQLRMLSHPVVMLGAMDGMDALDARILAAVTRRGRRLLTYAELAEEGASYREIEYRIATKRLQRIHHNVVLVGGGALPDDEEVHAAVLAGNGSAAASDLSALRMYGLGDHGRHLLQVSIPHGTKLTAKG